MPRTKQQMILNNVAFILPPLPPISSHTHEQHSPTSLSWDSACQPGSSQHAGSAGDESTDVKDLEYDSHIYEEIVFEEDDAVVKPSWTMNKEAQPKQEEVYII